LYSEIWNAKNELAVKILQVIEQNNKKTGYLILAIINIVLLILAFTSDSTGGGGDSIFHFLYAKYSWQNPPLFLNHWAKPLYTFLSSPFAQFGMIGAKFFNILMSLLGGIFALKIAQQTQTHIFFIIPLLLYGATLYVLVTLSGLTEPLSAAMLSGGVYFAFKRQFVLAAILVSFLPFVRSEGLILMLVFALYFLSTKNYRYLLFLLFGNFFMTIAGAFYHKDLLWVFTKIPYANVSHSYGSGNWYHFIFQLYFSAGPIIFSLTILGLIHQLYFVLKNIKNPNLYIDKTILIYGSFVAFILSHSIFWAFGMFHSMGLNRVLVTIFPLMAIIALDGLNFIIRNIKIEKMRNLVLALLSIGIVIFPFLKNPASFKIPEDFKLETSQAYLKNMVIPYIERKFSDKKLLFSDVGVAYFANKNPFNLNECPKLSERHPKYDLNPNEILIWDSWFTGYESGISIESLMNNKNIRLDTLFEFKKTDGSDFSYAVFEPVH